MTETPTPQPDIEPRHIGFFERRWNMVKAFGKQVYEHLFSIKTYVSSAVLFGGMALLSAHGGEIGKTLGGFFSVQPNVPSVLMAMGKALAIGTVFNAGIAMYKEAKRCDDCEALATQMERLNCQPQHGQSPTYEHYVQDQLTPAPTPPIYNAPQLGRDS
jgi:hypothetical protein